MKAASLAAASASINWRRNFCSLGDLLLRCLPCGFCSGPEQHVPTNPQGRNVRASITSGSAGGFLGSATFRECLSCSTMLFERRQSIFGIGLQVSILPVARFLVVGCDRGFVTLHHLSHIPVVKGRTLQLLEHEAHLLVRLVEPFRHS